MNNPTLAIIPSVPVWQKGEKLLFDRKFYDGLQLYTRFWPGGVSCVMSSTQSALPDFGVIEKLPTELPFTCIVIGEHETVRTEHINSADIVMASADAHNQLHIAALCRNRGIKCVYVIEYIPETRFQIADLEARNPLERLRLHLYLRKSERKRRLAFELCDGLQSNGTPAYQEYGNAPNRLLYFDTRVSRELIITDEELEKRLATLTEQRPLRLAFSGRLVQMKGADHLIQLALKLRKQGMNFHFTIYGTGDLAEEMKRHIRENELEHEVQMPGAVDFHRQLIPDLQTTVDLFVALHRQSDPSCTYLETLSCGVPIVGYRNRAFGGILELADTGWGTEPDDLDAIAGIIRHLDIERKEIATKSRNSVTFGRQHDFETTFHNRIDHLLSITMGERP
ncbi:MAG: glycosyltransferase [Chlorobiaceae bacterium]|nr:glycosyltransferase [Chlorobiaceae bacterium]